MLYYVCVVWPFFNSTFLCLCFRSRTLQGQTERFALPRFASNLFFPACSIQTHFLFLLYVQFKKADLTLAHSNRGNQCAVCSLRALRRLFECFSLNPSRVLAAASGVLKRKK